MDQSVKLSAARSTGFLQLGVCVLGFIVIALVLANLEEGGMADNGGALMVILGVLLVVVLVVLAVQRAALTIEADLLRHHFDGRLDFQDRELAAIERGLGGQGFLASALNRLGATRPPPGVPASVAAAPATATTPVVPPSAKAVKKAPAKKAPATVNRPGRATDSQA
jgi:hypothetical protein